MEQKFSNNSLDLQTLREFCEREGETVTFSKGDRLEREGEPARWFAYVERGCFKYVTRGISDGRDQHSEMADGRVSRCYSPHGFEVMMRRFGLLLVNSFQLRITHFALRISKPKLLRSERSPFARQNLCF